MERADASVPVIRESMATCLTNVGCYLKLTCCLKGGKSNVNVFFCVSILLYKAGFN